MRGGLGRRLETGLLGAAAAFVVLQHASRLVLASGDVEVEIYGARAGAERVGPLVRVTRYPRAWLPSSRR